MKKILFASIAWCAVCTASAQPYDRYYENLPFEMTPVVLPSIPDYTVCLTDFGGVGDGLALNTEAFARAMDALEARGGGKLVVPRGTWITGPIFLKSRVNLHVSDGALIYFTEDFDAYPLIETNWEGWTALRATSPIMAHNLTDIAITGNGVIDGNGDNWRLVKKEKMTDGQWRKLQQREGSVLDEAQRLWFPNEGAMKGYFDTRHYSELTAEEREYYKAYYRPVLASIVNCKRILLQGITFQNSPSWNVHPLLCQELTVDHVVIRNPWYSQNGDGLDVESCKNVLVVNSSFDVGDDAICIKSGKDLEGRQRGIPTENLIVDNCIVYHGHGGFVVGSEMSGGARNMLVRNCQFMSTDVGLRFKSTRGRGGVVERVWIENIDMTNIPNEALLFDLYYGRRDPNAPVPPVTEETPSFRDIHIKNITCRGAGTAMLFNGLPEMNVRNVTVENAVLQTTRGIVINESDQVKLSNIVIQQKTGPAVEMNQAKNVTIEALQSVNGVRSEVVRDGQVQAMLP
ncbi:MAG: glycoside hydrolase family 28 protein [Rikenellaceae bacterium]|nr:glycoside hydrolase family 28 protein [Rikenellaceae bacterium]